MNKEWIAFLENEDCWCHKITEKGLPHPCSDCIRIESGDVNRPTYSDGLREINGLMEGKIHTDKTFQEKTTIIAEILNMHGARYLGELKTLAEVEVAEAIEKTKSATVRRQIAERQN